MVSSSGGNARLFRLHRPGAGRVAIEGTFTGWGSSPIGLSAVGDGWWEARVELEPGDHEFVYVADGVERIADYGSSGVRLDRSGEWVSLLVVEPAREGEQGAKGRVEVVVGRKNTARAHAA